MGQNYYPKCGFMTFIISLEFRVFYGGLQRQKIGSFIVLENKEIAK